MNIFRKNAAIDALPRGEGPFRYRMYYWLMNAAFVWQVGATLVFDIAGFDPTILGFGITTAYIAIHLLFELIIMPLLIAVPFMRDEYAETLWKRTIYQVASVVAVGVCVMFIGNIVLHYTIGLSGMPQPFRGWYEGLFDETSYFRAITKFWGNFTIVFPILFQFNRWRDSRAASE